MSGRYPLSASAEYVDGDNGLLHNVGIHNRTIQHHFVKDHNPN